jgi:hypothetical protein
MEFEIKKVYEFKGLLRVEVEHEYGKENIGLSLDAKYLNEETGEPRWVKEVQELLFKKYGSRNSDKSIPKTDIFQEYHGKKFKTKEE